jgi:hypothetical protein
MRREWGEQIPNSLEQKNGSPVWRPAEQEIAGLRKAQTVKRERAQNTGGAGQPFMFHYKCFVALPPGSRAMLFSCSLLGTPHSVRNRSEVVRKAAQTVSICSETRGKCSFLFFSVLPCSDFLAPLPS